MILNKCCWDCENVCKLFFLLRCVCCIWPNVCDGCHFVKIFEIFWCRDIRVCTCGKNRYETGDFHKNRYKFYMKFILLIDTWHIIFIFLNDCSWCELSEYIWCSWCWIIRYALFFSLKHSHFTINKEGPNNGSTWPLISENVAWNFNMSWKSQLDAFYTDRYKVGHYLFCYSFFGLKLFFLYKHHSK